MRLPDSSRFLPTRPRARRTWPLGLALAATLVLAACGKEPATPEPVRAVRTLTVGQLSGATTRDYAAEVHARVESKLAFRVGGKITQRPVNLGDRVRNGQALAQLDPADLRFGQDAARAGLAAAQVNYEQTAADYKRYEDLQAQGFVSAADLERRNSGLQAAKAQFDQARAQAGMQANQAATRRSRPTRRASSPRSTPTRAPWWAPARRC